MNGIECEKHLTLVHGYGFDERGRDKPDVRGRLTILAALELKRQGFIDQIALTAGVQQAGERALAGPMLRQLHRNNPNLLYQDVLFSTAGIGTTGEIEEFKKISNKEKTDNLAVLATETHAGRIKRRLKKKFGKSASEITIFTVEDVLTNMVESRRYAGLVEGMLVSEDESAFKKREATIRQIERIPFGAYFVDSMVRLLPNRFEVWNSIRKSLKLN